MTFKEFNARRAIDEKTGIDSDEVDVKSQIDESIGLDENLDRLEDQFETDLRKDEPQGRVNSFENALEAKEIHADRSKVARRVDNERKAKTQLIPGEMTNPEFDKWKENPDELDIQGVDGPGSLF